MNTLTITRNAAATSDQNAKQLGESRQTTVSSEHLERLSKNTAPLEKSVIHAMRYYG